MFPHIYKQLVDKMWEDHQKAIEERDTRIEAIEYENVAFKARSEMQGELLLILLQIAMFLDPELLTQYLWL